MKPDFFRIPTRTKRPVTAKSNGGVELHERVCGNEAVRTTTHRLLPFFFTLGIACLAACGERDLGKERLSSHNRIELTEFMRLGVEADGDKVLFGNIRSIAVNQSGEIFVGEGLGSIVYVFSPDGQLERQFGGEGDGPGEFSWLQDIVIGPSDSVFVLDWWQRRVSVFAPNSFGFERSISLQGIERFEPASLLGVTKQGLMVQYSTGGVGMNTPIPTMRGSATLGGGWVMLVNRHGEPVDSLVGLRYHMPFLATSDGAVMVSRPFVRSSMLALGPGDILYSGWSDSIDVVKTSSGGQPIGRLIVPHEPLPATRSDLEHVLERLDARGQQLVRSTELANTLPAYLSLIVDDASRAWIKLGHSLSAATAQWLIVDDESSVIGQAELPSGVSLMAVRYGRAFGQLEDPQTNAPVIIGYEITPP